MIYLDNAATTPVSERVAEIMCQYLTRDYGNAGSRTHEYGLTAKKAVNEARAGIANLFNASPEELIFTSGSTESNNIAILGLGDFGRKNNRNIVATSPTEHKSVLEPMEFMKNQGFSLKYLGVSPMGEVRAEEVQELLLHPECNLVSLMHVNNETGIVHNIDQISEQSEERSGFFHVDASQGFLKFPDFTYKGVDLISVSAHKIGGPKGIGALLARRKDWKSVPLNPLTYGGGQERNLRPGTLPVHQIMGFWEAVQERLELHAETLLKTEEFGRHLRELIHRCGGKINGSAGTLAPGILSVYFPGIDSEALVLALKGIAAVATGSACTSSEYTPSHVLTAMNSGQDSIDGSVRISWMGSPTSDFALIEAAIKSLK